MRHSQKSQYAEIKERVVYILLSPLSQEFFIGHTRKDLLKDIFKDHYYGQRYQTKNCCTELRKQELHPCLFILEELTCTKVEAYNHVVAWTRIFHDAGFINLNHGNVETYMEDLLEKNFSIYNARKSTNIFQRLKCKNCFVANYGRKQCQFYEGE